MHRASCTVAGAKFISEKFSNAYIELKEGDTFERVLNAPNTILTPITVKPYKYTRGGPK